MNQICTLSSSHPYAPGVPVMCCPRQRLACWCLPWTAIYAQSLAGNYSSAGRIMAATAMIAQTGRQAWSRCLIVLVTLHMSSMVLILCTQACFTSMTADRMLHACNGEDTTLKLSLFASDRETLIRLLAANLVLEYHIRPPSERRTIVAFNVISSTCMNTTTNSDKSTRTKSTRISFHHGAVCGAAFWWTLGYESSSEIHATAMLCRLVHCQGQAALSRHHVMSTRAYQAQYWITTQVLLVWCATTIPTDVHRWDKQHNITSKLARDRGQTFEVTVSTMILSPTSKGCTTNR